MIRSSDRTLLMALCCKSRRLLSHSPRAEKIANADFFRRKLALDANAVAQEKGIEAVLAIVRESGENSAK